MQPLSMEIRKLIVVAKERGEKCADIMKWLQVSDSSVEAIWNLYRKTGDISPIPYIGRKSRLSEEMINSINKKLEAEPDATLEEIILDLKLPIKKSRLSIFLIRQGYTVKKKLYTHKPYREKMS